MKHYVDCRMGEDGLIPRLSNVNVKALLGILAGAGASYGLYKLLRGRGGDTEINKAKPRKNNITAVQPGSLMAKVSGFNVVSRKDGGNLTAEVSSSEVLSKSPGSLEPKHLSMLLSLLQSSPNPAERREVLKTLGNAAAFTVNQQIQNLWDIIKRKMNDHKPSNQAELLEYLHQVWHKAIQKQCVRLVEENMPRCIKTDLLREFGGLHIIAGFLSDPVPDVRVQTLNALNNLSMNIRNQEQLKVYVPSVVQLIEMSPVNSDLQLAGLRLLTNLTVTDDNQHLMKNSITLLLSLLVVSNELLQVQALKVLVNLSSNPDMMDDIVQTQAPASLVLLFDGCTNTEVLLRLLFFVGNLRAWRPSAQVAEALRRQQDSLYCVLLDSSSQFHSRLPLLLTHPDEEIKAQVARLLT